MRKSNRRSPLSMSHLVDKIGVAIHNAKSNAHDFAQVSKSLAEEKLLDVAYVDLTFQVSFEPLHFLTLGLRSLQVYRRFGYPKDGCRRICRSIFRGQARQSHLDGVCDNYCIANFRLIPATGQPCRRTLRLPYGTKSGKSRMFLSPQTYMSNCSTRTSAHPMMTILESSRQPYHLGLRRRR